MKSTRMKCDFLCINTVDYMHVVVLVVCVFHDDTIKLEPCCTLINALQCYNKKTAESSVTPLVSDVHP
jgi:hypothetical protein